MGVRALWPHLREALLPWTPLRASGGQWGSHCQEALHCVRSLHSDKGSCSFDWISNKGSSYLREVIICVLRNLRPRFRLWWPNPEPCETAAGTDPQVSTGLLNPSSLSPRFLSWLQRQVKATVTWASYLELAPRECPVDLVGKRGKHSQPLLSELEASVPQACSCMAPQRPLETECKSWLRSVWSLHIASGYLGPLS